jgi:hypothetical protein
MPYHDPLRDYDGADDLSSQSGAGYADTESRRFHSYDDEPRRNMYQSKSRPVRSEAVSDEEFPPPGVMKEDGFLAKKLMELLGRLHAERRKFNECEIKLMKVKNRDHIFKSFMTSAEDAKKNRDDQMQVVEELMKKAKTAWAKCEGEQSRHFAKVRRG